MRRLLALVFAALVFVACLGETEATCYLEGYEKHPCPSQLVADTPDGYMAVGKLTGQQLFDWYGDLPAGTYTFVVEKDGGSDRVTFELG